MTDELGKQIIATIKSSLKMNVAELRITDHIGEHVFLDAWSDEPHVYMVQARTLYQAACLLAELVGFDLEE